MNRQSADARQTRGVNRDGGWQSLRGHTAGEKRGVLFRNTAIEVASRMYLGKMREAGSARHRGGDGHDLLIRLGEFRKRLANNFRICGRRCRRGLATLDLVFAESMKFVGLLERWRVSFAFLSENVQQHRFFLSFQKLKCPDQQWNIVPVNWSVVT